MGREISVLMQPRNLLILVVALVLIFFVFSISQQQQLQVPHLLLYLAVVASFILGMYDFFGLLVCGSDYALEDVLMLHSARLDLSNNSFKEKLIFSAGVSGGGQLPCRL